MSDEPYRIKKDGHVRAAIVGPDGPVEMTASPYLWVDRLNAAYLLGAARADLIRAAAIRAAMPTGERGRDA